MPHICKATWEYPWVGQEAEAVGGKHGQQPALWFTWERTGEAR